MLIYKTYKFQSYPNLEQQILLVKTLGCNRFVFNYLLLYEIEHINKQRKD
ncbi:helix-turn-helix domain-containing protein [Bacillus pacificus]|nr:helix-turn-helix domain-containing protein [Bacillus pacificus]